MYDDSTPRSSTSLSNSPQISATIAAVAATAAGNNPIVSLFTEPADFMLNNSIPRYGSSSSPNTGNASSTIFGSSDASSVPRFLHQQQQQQQQQPQHVAQSGASFLLPGQIAAEGEENDAAAVDISSSSAAAAHGVNSSSTAIELELILSHQRDRALRGEIPAVPSMQQEIERRQLFVSDAERARFGHEHHGSGSGGGSPTTAFAVAPLSWMMGSGDDAGHFVVETLPDGTVRRRKQTDDEIEADETKPPEVRDRARRRRLAEQERAALRAQLSEEDNRSIERAVDTIEMQQAIKELQVREMDLMRLTGAEMEDMWSRRGEYRYSEYRKLLEAEAAAKAAEAAAAASASSDASGGGGGDDSRIVAGSASGVHMKRSALLEHAAKRELPRLFQIVASKPPPVRDFAALSGRIVLDRMPPDPEIHEIAPDGALLPAGHSSLAIAKAASQDELRLMGKIKKAGDASGVKSDEDARDGAKRWQLERDAAERAVRAQRIADIAAEAASRTPDRPASASLASGRRRSPGSAAAAASNGATTPVPVIRDEDGKELEIDVTAGAAAAGAASPHLFDCFRHARHRAIFSEAMQRRREERGETSEAAHTSSTFQQLMLAEDERAMKNMSKHQQQLLMQKRAAAVAASRLQQPHYVPVSMSEGIPLPSSKKIFDAQRKREERRVQRAVDASLQTASANDSTPSVSGVFGGGAESAAKTAPQAKSKDLKQLMFEQKVLLRKAERSDQEKYAPLLRSFVAHQEEVGNRMWG